MSVPGFNRPGDGGGGLKLGDKLNFVNNLNAKNQPATMADSVQTLINKITILPSNPAPGNNTVVEDTASYTTTLGTNQLLSKKITVNYTGTVRVNVTAHINNNPSGSLGYITLYKNGVAYSQEFTLSTTSNLTASFDIACNVGDYFQVYGRSNNTSNSILVTDFKLSVGNAPTATLA